MLNSRKWPCRDVPKRTLSELVALSNKLVWGRSCSTDCKLHHFRKRVWEWTSGEICAWAQWICPLYQADVSSQEPDITMLFQNSCGPESSACESQPHFRECAEYLRKIRDVKNVHDKCSVRCWVKGRCWWMVNLQTSCRQPDRQRMNDLWEKTYLMMLGYLSSLTHSVFIHLLALSLHYPSPAHRLSLSSCEISLSQAMFYFFHPQAPFCHHHH